MGAKSQVAAITISFGKMYLRLNVIAFHISRDIVPQIEPELSFIIDLLEKSEPLGVNARKWLDSATLLHRNNEVALRIDDSRGCGLVTGS